MTCSKEIKEVYNRPIDLPKTVPLWIVTLISLILGSASFYLLYSERSKKHRDDSMEAEIIKLSAQIKELNDQAKDDEELKTEAKKKAEQFFEQVKKLQLKSNK